MSVQISLLFREKHAHLKIRRYKAFAHAEKQQIVPVTFQEFVSVGAELPVVFVKNSETGQFESVVLLAFKAGENLMIKDGEWQGHYAPMALRHYPLALTPDPQQSEQLLVALVESSPMVNEFEGQALFNEDGSDSDYLKAVTESMGEFFRQTEATKSFNKLLADMDLLVSQALTVNIEGKPTEINGIYVINEKKLTELSNEHFYILRQRGLLPAIYAHLMSLQQIRGLCMRKSR
ncbi:SapC [Rheinheimera sp. A13L]|uniref:SapC family protein n=1 Tax=Rheinheimera sp. A13L TaxID=506534 RepID=UPI0002125373|nr:SapC family protein [Rheinheimera sp. A13L]EGM76795.1 SapC [Rheinheimera sp. A13L]